ncbi:MAG TPA: metalloregulator ArsR/SmtB family transcription factor [Tianweitania sediminis]|jgi:DNA-binding transcriptional ArsR family regulator|nr:metalloregulator ArsR/SmtB family transcription factor [Tianweitania sediminis]
MMASPDDANADGQTAERLAALAHPTRLRILRELSDQPACCCKEVVARLDLAQSTVSQHLKVLVAAGLVRYTPDKQRSHYSLDRVALKKLSAALQGFVDCCCTADTCQNPGKPLA